MQLMTSRSMLRLGSLSLALVGGLACGSKEPTTSTNDYSMEPDDDDDDDDGKVDAGPKKDAGKDAKVDDNTKKDTGTKPVDPDDGTNKCAGIRQDAPPASGGVDVIFVIDTSGSMLHALTQVQANMGMFVQNFEGTAADTRVVVITADDPARGTDVANDKDKYRFLPSGVDSKVLFQVAKDQFKNYEDFLRAGAATQFVMITDDNDREGAAQFKTEMEGLLGHPFTQHAIASEDVNGLPCISEAQLWNPLCTAPIPAVCAAASIGKQYYDLADQTDGEKLSICKADWAPVFEQLRAAVIAAVPLPCAYPLADATSATFDPDKVQVVYTPAGGDDQEFPKAESMEKCAGKVGWYYDNPSDPTSIQLCPTACTTVAAGGSLDVALGCKPIVLL